MNRVMITGTNSGCGKTTVVCAVLQALKNRGCDVSSFKCGPDYIDTMFHSKIIGAPSRNIDSFFFDDDTMKYLLCKNSREISVIEGVMGFYDGVGAVSSSHEISEKTETPVIAVVDCKGMSYSVGAVMKGFLTYRRNRIRGFIFNRLSPKLIDDIKNICRELDTEFIGYLPNNKDYALESRHLGLVTADEMAGLKQKMQLLSEAAENYINIDRIIEIAGECKELTYNFNPPERICSGIRIAVARDKAFCFYYDDNIELLKELGCEIAEFSPLTDKALPDNISGLYFGGGYPELYAKQLSDNVSLINCIKSAVSGGMPTIAECGGFMYLCRSIENENKEKYEMVGLINAECFRTDKLRRFGYITLTAESDGLLCRKGNSVKAHEFHYWDCTDNGADFTAEKAGRSLTYPCVHSSETVYAGFPHIHFYTDTGTAERYVSACVKYRENKDNGQN